MSSPSRSGPANPDADRRGLRVARHTHPVDVEHAVHVGRAQLEHVLHAGERRDRVDVARAAARRSGPGVRCVRTRASGGTRRKWSGRSRARLARGFSARLRAVFEKNWFESATRSSSTMRTRERYVMFGVPSAGGGRDDGGDRALEAQLEVAQRELAHGDARFDTRARAGSGRLVEELARRVRRRRRSRPERGGRAARSGVAVGLLDRAEERVAELRGSDLVVVGRGFDAPRRCPSAGSIEGAHVAGGERHGVVLVEVLESLSRRRRRSAPGARRRPTAPRDTPPPCGVRLAVGADAADEQAAAPTRGTPSFRVDSTVFASPARS